MKIKMKFCAIGFQSVPQTAISLSGHGSESGNSSLEKGPQRGIGIRESSKFTVDPRYGTDTVLRRRGVRAPTTVGVGWYEFKETLKCVFTFENKQLKTDI